MLPRLRPTEAAAVRRPRALPATRAGLVRPAAVRRVVPLPLETERWARPPSAVALYIRGLSFRRGGIITPISNCRDNHEMPPP